MLHISPKVNVDHSHNLGWKDFFIQTNLEVNLASRKYAWRGQPVKAKLINGILDLLNSIIALSICYCPKQSQLLVFVSLYSWATYYYDCCCLTYVDLYNFCFFIIIRKVTQIWYILQQLHKNEKRCSSKLTNQETYKEAFVLTFKETALVLLKRALITLHLHTMMCFIFASQ